MLESSDDELTPSTHSTRLGSFVVDDIVRSKQENKKRKKCENEKEKQKDGKKINYFFWFSLHIFARILIPFKLSHSMFRQYWMRNVGRLVVPTLRSLNCLAIYTMGCRN